MLDQVVHVQQGLAVVYLRVQAVDFQQDPAVVYRLAPVVDAQRDPAVDGLPVRVAAYQLGRVVVYLMAPILGVAFPVRITKRQLLPQIQSSIAECLGNMHALHGINAAKVCQSPRHAQHAVITARG
jgi:hypothetical protein